MLGKMQKFISVNVSKGFEATGIIRLIVVILYSKCS